jgi:subtilisin family serine protease
VEVFMIRLRFLLTLSLIPLAFTACADSNHPGRRGSQTSASSAQPAPAVATTRSALSASDQRTVWVLLKQQANLTAARTTRDWRTRGRMVYDQLTSTASTTQAPLLTFLRTRGVRAQSFWILNALKVTADQATIDLLSRRPDVSQVLPDRAYTIPPSRPGTQLRGVNAVEWNISNVRAPDAWAAFGARGEGIVVANVDTGVQFDHPALVRQYRGNLGGGSFDHNYNWYDPASVCGSPSNAPCDNAGHGTHTMGTMVGDDGDPGTNQIGVAPHARWIAAKGCESDSCSSASLLAAGQWILAPTDLTGNNPRPDLRPQVVNNSWGGGANDTFYQATVQAWVAAGIFPSFSYGNSGPTCGSGGSPGDYPESYAVGAHDISNVSAFFSSRGPSPLAGIKPNISAPGLDVRSSVPGNGYEVFSGTSMASPHVAGSVALLWSAAPALVGDIAATRALLDATAIDTSDVTCGGTPDNNNVYGQGRLDDFALVDQSPRGPTGTLNGVVSGPGGAPIAGATVHASGPSERSVVTDASGAFSALLPVGTYSVTASAFGFLSQTATEVAITEGNTTTHDFVLAAAPSHSVSGDVRDGTGGALPGAKVTIEGTPIPTAIADASGHYAFAAVPEGTYKVTASAGGCFDSVTTTLVVDSDETLPFVLPQHSDSFGYKCRPAPFAFVEANTVLPVTGDLAFAPVPLPFPFTLYGQSYDQAWVFTKGLVTFSQPTFPPFENSPIPDPLEPNAAVYGFWDDIVVDSSASVRMEVVGTAPNRQVVFEWRDVAFFADPTVRVRFEIILSENGAITTQYHTAGPAPLQRGGAATIGLENETGTVALQYSANTPSVDSGTAIAFTLPPSGFVTGKVTDANDGLPVGGATIDASQNGVSIRATHSKADGSYRMQLPVGSYTLTASFNGYAGIAVPITVALDGTVKQDFVLKTARAKVTPGAVTVVTTAGQVRTRTLVLENTGSLNLDYKIAEAGGAKQTAVSTAKVARNPVANPSAVNTKDLFSGNQRVGGWRAEAVGDVLKSFTPAGLGVAFGIGFQSNLWFSDPATGKNNVEFTTDGAATGRKWTADWANQWPGDMAYDAGRKLMCQVNVGGDNGIYCWDPATGTVGGSITGAFPWSATSQRGLAYRQDDDSFYIGGWNDGTIYHVKGLAAADKGALISSCKPADGLISGLAWNGAAGVLWASTNSQTDTIYELDPTDCTVLSTVAHPATGGFQGCGLELDEGGNLWTAGQNPPKVFLLESGVPLFTDVPWLSVTPQSGTLVPGAKQSLKVTIDTKGLTPGIYLASVFIQTTAGRGGTVRIPVSLVVSGYQQGVNAGGASYKDGSGDTWSTDKAFAAGSWGYVQKSKTDTTGHAISGTTDPKLFQSQRVDPYSYSFDKVPNGVYQVELDFAELDSIGFGKRLFDVIVEQTLELPAHDVAFEVGRYAADKHTFFLDVTDGRLDVRLIPRAGSLLPFVSAVRVTERPDR